MKYIFVIMFTISLFVCLYLAFSNDTNGDDVTTEYVEIGSLQGPYPIDPSIVATLNKHQTEITALQLRLLFLEERLNGQ